MKTITYVLLISLILLPAFGCSESLRSDPSTLESAIEIAKAFTIANTASTPVNPYSLPIGIGLAGLTAMLEALRRKERAGRKHAEHKLNNGNNDK